MGNEINDKAMAQVARATRYVNDYVLPPLFLSTSALQGCRNRKNAYSGMRFTHWPFWPLGKMSQLRSNYKQWKDTNYNALSTQCLLAFQILISESNLFPKTRN